MHPITSLRELAAELRRRRVTRVAGIYLLVGWLVIQVAVTVFPYLQLPSWTVTLVIALTALGFPIAAALAWTLEVTPEGVRVERRGAPAEKDDQLPRNATSTVAAEPEPARMRLIVLPFRALRPDPETDFLAFSLPEAITSSLTGLESVVVRSHLASLRFGDAPDLGAIAAGAGVDLVLSGTLVRLDERLRVSTQLTATGDGTLLWSQVSDVTLGDLFQLQDQLAHRILDSIRLPLTDRDRSALRRDVPSSARAYEFYLRANQVAYQVGSWPTARDLYLESVREDPGYAPAWAGLGRCYRLIGKYSPDPAEVRDSLARAEEAFRRALELSPELPRAHNLYAQLEVDLGRAPQAMLRLLGRARGGSVDPEIFAGLVHACRFCGLLEDSLRAHHRARGLDPTATTSVAHTLWHLGRYAEAMDWTFGDIGYMPGLALASQGREGEAVEALRERERAAGDSNVRAYLASLRALLEGRRAESLAAIEEAIHDLRDGEARYYLARSLVRLGESERGLAELERVVHQGFLCPSLEHDPWLAPLHTDVRFRALVRRVSEKRGEAEQRFREAGGEVVLSADAVSLHA